MLLLFMLPAATALSASTFWTNLDGTATGSPERSPLFAASGAIAPPPSPVASPSSSKWTIREPNPEHFTWAVTYFVCNLEVVHNGTVIKEANFVTLVYPPEHLNPVCTEYRTGYLNVPLDYDDSRSTSRVFLELRVSAKLECQEESCPLLLYHNGGPSSNDGAAQRDAFGGRYNTIGIAQRGIGENTRYGWYPSPKPVMYNGNFAGDWYIHHRMKTTSSLTDYDADYLDSTASFPVGKHANNKIIPDHPSDECSKVEPGSNVPVPKKHRLLIDPVEDRQAIRDTFHYIESTLRNCVANKYWKIDVPGQTRKANFLDYVGTHLLTLDIDRLREAFGAEKLSCYGYSYGTAVCSAYAATFPEHIDLFVANGNVDYPGTTDTYQINVADAFNQLASKLLEICKTAYGNYTCLGDPEYSPSEVLEQTTYLVRNNPRFAFEVEEGEEGEIFKYPVGYIYMQARGVRMESNSSKWIDALDAVKGEIGFVFRIVGMESEEDAKQIVAQKITSICGSEEWRKTGFCGGWAFSSMGTTEAVNSLDYANRFGWLQAEMLTHALLGKYSPLAVSAAVQDGPSYLMYPREPTPCMYGYRDKVKGIVINSLYDGATPFVNAKTMRGGMSGTVLVTWQGIGHCVTGRGADSYDPEGVQACMNQVTKYFESYGAELPRDGFTCRNSEKIIWEEGEAREEHERRRLLATHPKKEL